ncbi:hypothetical protein [Rhodococcus koreensis]
MMLHLTAAQRVLLREVQDCATALHRWLAIDSNGAALMAYLRGEPVARTWLATGDARISDCVDKDCPRGGPDGRRRSGRRPAAAPREGGNSGVRMSAGSGARASEVSRMARPRMFREQ